jgi:hypothetical protein
MLQIEKIPSNSGFVNLWGAATNVLGFVSNNVGSQNLIPDECSTGCEMAASFLTPTDCLSARYTWQQGATRTLPLYRILCARLARAGLRIALIARGYPP